METFEKIEMHYAALRNLWLEHWLNNVIFTPQWWILVLTFVIPYIIWWKLVDKSRLRDIVLIGLQAALISYLLDQIGTALALWIYPYSLTPLEREVFDPADFSAIPVSYMLIFQYFSKWKKYFLALVVFALIASYGAGSFYQWLGIYKLENWKHIYSTILYIMLGLFMKWVLSKIKSREAAE